MPKNSDSISTILNGPCFIGISIDLSRELLSKYIVCQFGIIQFSDLLAVLIHYSLWRRVFLAIKYGDSSQSVADYSTCHVFHPSFCLPEPVKVPEHGFLVSFIHTLTFLTSDGV